MQSIPVDTSRLGALLCVVAPEPKIANRETGEAKTDRDGVTVWTVGVSVRQSGSRRTDVIEIAVSGEPHGVDEGMRVTVVDLVAFTWQQGDRHGTSFRAASVTAADAARLPAAAIAPAKAPKGGDV